MQRTFVILGVCVALMLGVGASMADDYVEDVYYWQEVAAPNSSNGYTPYYRTNAREIIFIDDSAASAHPDTIRAVLREAQPMENIQ